MHGLDSTEIAAALLFEARGLVAGETGDSDWPLRARRSSALGVLTSAWVTFPRRDAAGREGFALARRALRGAVSDDEVISEVAPTPALRDAFDRALDVLEEA
jgi:hypothetical protein